jgi:hypothetical protein
MMIVIDLMSYFIQYFMRAIKKYYISSVWSEVEFFILKTLMSYKEDTV